MTIFEGPEKRKGPADRRESVMWEYIRGFFVKILENLSSAKVWFFILPFIVSSLFMGKIILQQANFVGELIKLSVKDAIILEAINNSFKIVTDTFGNWCVFNVSLTGTIVVVRETFKVSKLHALRQTDNHTTIKKVQV